MSDTVFLNPQFVSATLSNITHRFVLVLECEARHSDGGDKKIVNPPKFAVGGPRASQDPRVVPVNQLLNLATHAADIQIPSGWEKVHQYIYVMHHSTDDHGWQYRSKWSEGALTAQDEPWVAKNDETKEVRRRLWMTTVVRRANIMQAKEMLSNGLQELRRNIIMEGSLNIFNYDLKLWSRKRVKLTHQSLDVYDDQGAVMEQSIPLNSYNARMLLNAQIKGREWVFFLRDVANGQSVVFEAQSREHRRRWVVAISYQIALLTPDCNFPPFDYGPPILQEELINRTLICGELLKKGHIIGNWKPRFFQLTSRELRYFEKDVIKGKLSIENAQFKNDEKNMEFSIRAISGAVLAMKTESPAVRDAWVRAIEWQIQAIRGAKLSQSLTSEELLTLEQCILPTVMSSSSHKEHAKEPAKEPVAEVSARISEVHLSQSNATAVATSETEIDAKAEDASNEHVAESNTQEEVQEQSHVAHQDSNHNEVSTEEDKNVDKADEDSHSHVDTAATETSEGVSEDASVSHQKEADEEEGVNLGNDETYFEGFDNHDSNQEASVEEAPVEETPAAATEDFQEEEEEEEAAAAQGPREDSVSVPSSPSEANHATESTDDSHDNNNNNSENAASEDSNKTSEGSDSAPREPPSSPVSSEQDTNTKRFSFKPSSSAPPISPAAFNAKRANNQPQATTPSNSKWKITQCGFATPTAGNNSNNSTASNNTVAPSTPQFESTDDDFGMCDVPLTPEVEARMSKRLVAAAQQRRSSFVLTQIAKHEAYFEKAGVSKDAPTLKKKNENMSLLR